MQLINRNIVITGGTSGIGFELVRQLHPENRVLVIARNHERLKRLEDEFEGLRTCCADLSNPANVDSAAAMATNHFTRVDVLINNAAVQYLPAFLDDGFCVATIEEEISINFTAVCKLTALLLPHMLHEHPAAIVNINSGLGLVPKTNSAIYCATKAAMNSFSLSLRHQLSSTNVNVMQAFVPLVETSMTAGRGDRKLSASDAATAILKGVRIDIADNDIGNIRLLRSINRIAPRFAQKIMKTA